ncbi:hypothetical protein AAFF_G00424920 [Aldrovandia affinis]|uniref:Uncharacterized protein n=1 Tax=Aldrovandia affinis TaxID=143900 RepID=A0AAD7X018_9TELE|nr:hypothetical protein AAFF_G00424920 [Aldrovandia affinis]
MPAARTKAGSEHRHQTAQQPREVSSSSSSSVDYRSAHVPAKPRNFWHVCRREEAANLLQLTRPSAAEWRLLTPPIADAGDGNRSLGDTTCSSPVSLPPVPGCGCSVPWGPQVGSARGGRAAWIAARSAGAAPPRGSCSRGPRSEPRDPPRSYGEGGGVWGPGRHKKEAISMIKPPPGRPPSSS